jgi:hypothetical protein
MLSSNHSRLCFAKPYDAGNGVSVCVKTVAQIWILTVFAENAAGDRGGGP